MSSAIRIWRKRHIRQRWHARRRTPVYTDEKAVRLALYGQHGPQPIDRKHDER